MTSLEQGNLRRLLGGGEWGRWGPCACVLVLVLALASCATKPEIKVKSASGSMFIGDRNKGASIRASEDRPQPWDDEKPVWGTDRMGLEESRARESSEHQEAHATQGLSGVEVSHPACKALKPEVQKHCPLTLYTWSQPQSVPGGISIRCEADRESWHGLRLVALCHRAMASAGREVESCPFHVPGVRLRFREEGHSLVMILTANKAEQVEAIRTRMLKIVR